jgi:hypothetical protein
MATRPGIRELSSGAKMFVRDHNADLRHCAKSVLAPIIVTQAIGTIGAAVWPLLGLFQLVALYFWCCFILDWHRLVLLGRSSVATVNPFRLKAGEGKFILVFLIITLLNFCPSILALILGSAGNRPGFWPLFVAIAGPIAAIVLSLRFSFMLPAQSVNVQLTLGETGPISYGLKWRLFAAGLVTSFLPALLIMLMVLIVHFVNGSVLHFIEVDGAKQGQLTLPGAVLAFVLAGIPSVFIYFVIMARNVTVLSRLYQWSVQNRQGQIA